MCFCGGHMSVRSQLFCIPSVGCDVMRALWRKGVIMCLGQRSGRLLVSGCLLEWFLPSEFPPPIHLTASNVMVIVWRLWGNIIITVLYIANLLPLRWAQLTKTVHTARLGLEFVFLCFFRLHDLLVYVLFYQRQLSHFPSCCGAGVTNLNEPPSSFTC